MIGLRIVKPKVKLLTPTTWMESMPQLVEYCGRISHKSEGRMKPGSSYKFIRKVAQRLGHESILEHANISYLITCDRACSHQIVRHRLGAYTQASQRYCDYSKGANKLLDVILPPSIGDQNEGTIIRDYTISSYSEFDKNEELWYKSILDSYKSYLELRCARIPPEDARSVLPNATATEIAVTFNIRMWRHVFKQRALNKHAQWQIRDVFTYILNDLLIKLPVFFDDLVK